MRRAAIALAIGCGITGAAAILAAAYFAREVVVPKTLRKEDLEIRRVLHGADEMLMVELPASARTTAPGRYSIWFANGTGHACIGEIVSCDDAAGTVTRRVERVDSGDLMTAKAGIWSGYVYATPEPLGLPYSDVQVPVENGMAPAWQFPPAQPSGDSSTWAIHIHGLGGSKAGALRGVPVADRLGYTSLVVSLRNDRDAPASADGRYHLGQTEWHDVEAAVSYAVGQGARQIVLFGWSLGASIALQLAASSGARHVISRLVLNAPVIDWGSTLVANARSSGLPSWVARLGLQMLGSAGARWVTGLDAPLDFLALDFLARADELSVPILVIHNEGDRSTPFAISREFVSRRPELATLLTFPSAEHTQEWNSDPDGWDAAVEGWLRSVPSSSVSL
ncbi:alpha/beta fold hydrolase [Arthrobacter oryzae]|uniref:alpha/beta hydrolase n=1 Tax=Arthrobacter oryzae TaxID=409290 RepID=UPI00285DB05F|nr:alpha/beta fold hydrolase [Arthrobacter oryzae]MDR6507710.1 pimeloyl-ACP methyl ester carboxylesterase [Arthrobacter oryzae]